MKSEKGIVKINFVQNPFSLQVMTDREFYYNSSIFTRVLYCFPLTLKTPNNTQCCFLWNRGGLSNLE